MPEYLAPGVYVEEVERGPKPIEGVSTSTVGFLGQTERGPVEPRLITTSNDFERVYGGFQLYGAGERLASTYLGYAVQGFFDNGGRRCYIGRIEAEETTATGTLQGSETGGTTPRVDFGSVLVTNRRTETLTFTNESDVPVRIDTGNIGRPPAGVFEVGTPTEASLDPGASTYIDVTYQPTDTSRSDATLTVPYGDPELASTRDFVVELVGQGTETIAAEVLEVGFEEVPVGGVGATRRIRLTNVSGETVELGTPSTTGDAFTAETDDEELGSNGSTTLVVTFAPQPADLGTVTTPLTVPFTAGTTTDDVEINLTGEATHALVPSEQGLDFGRVDATGVATDPTSVTLTNRSDADVTVDPDDIIVTSLSPSGDFPIDTGGVGDPIPPGEQLTLDVRFRAGDADRVEEDLEVTYAVDGATPSDPVTIELVGQGPSDLEATPLRIEMERQFAGTASAEVTIINRAGNQVTLNAADAEVTDGSAAIAGFDVEITPTHAELAGDGDQAIIGVTFDTTAMATPGDTTVEGTLAIPYEVGTTSPTTDTLTLPVTVDVTDSFDAATTVVLGTISAVGPGVWGRNVVIDVEEGTQYTPTNPVFRVQIGYWARDEDAALARERGPFTNNRQQSVPTPDVYEVYDNLSLVESSSNYFVPQINRGSSLVEISRQGTAVPTGWDVEPIWLDGAFTRPTPTVDLGHYEGNDTPGERTGLNAFDEVDEISIVCAPDENSVDGLTDALVTHCENLGDRFAVLQASEGSTDTGALMPPRDSSYAAFYYPWLEIIDPVTRGRKRVPPGGHVAGIYARSDTQRGVHKAPANEQVRGVQALEFVVKKGEHEILNPRGVNVIRSERGRGMRVMGARTTSSDPLWKYVNVRRLFLYIEESIDEATQWVVFEPNNEELWARVRQTLEAFLDTVWRDGALMGTTPEEAYFVRCDRSTMTQNDIDNGRLIAEIGVAPTKPAEFVVFRIAQWTAGAEGA